MNAADVISRLAAEEKRILSHEFVAPVTIGGKVRVRISGVVKTMSPAPSSFFGWGLFRAEGKGAKLVREAEPWEKDEYLSSLRRRMRFRLCVRRGDDSWWGCPSNAGQAKSLGFCGHQVVWLAGCSQFDMVMAATDGANWWFASKDPQDDPAIADGLRSALSSRSQPGSFRIRGMSAEDRSCYDTALDPFRAGLPGFRPKDEDQLSEALRRGGGRLLSYEDHGDHWTVEWQDGLGARHTSAVGKLHQTVLSAGICLSGRDRDFDLLSLVGVTERSGRRLGGRSQEDDDDY